MLAPWLGSEGVINEIRVPLQRSADAGSFAARQIVVQEVVGPADRVEQVPGGEVGIRLVVGVAPRFVIDRRERPTPRGGEILGLAIDGVCQRRFGNRECHIVLRASFLRSRYRRGRPLQGREVRGHCRPLHAMSAARAFAKRLEPGFRDENARMHSNQLRLQGHLVGEEHVKGRHGFLPGRHSGGGDAQEHRAGDRQPFRHAVCSSRRTATPWIRPASSSVTTRPTGPRTADTRNTGV